jgi:hypothetical protein
MSSIETTDVVAKDRVGNDLRIGDRAVYGGNGDHNGWTDTILRIVGKGMGDLLLTVPEAKKANGADCQYHGEFTDDNPAHLNRNSMTRLKEEPEVIGTDKDGNSLHVGDEVEYIPGNEDWAGARFRVLPEEADDTAEFVTVPDTLTYKVGEQVHLNFSDLRLVQKEEKVSTGLTYTQNDQPIYVGDDVVWIGQHDQTLDPGLLGARAKVEHAYETGTSIRVVREGGQGAVWHRDNIAPLGHDTGHNYTDQKPVGIGDRIVVNPGENFAGTEGVVIGSDGQYLHTLLVGQGITYWTPSKVSRLQDEDKAKLADDVSHEPTPAHDKLREVLELLAGLREDVAEQVGSIESELESAEQREVSVSMDADDVRSAVSVSTSNSELLSYISYDGDGMLSINDSAVDEHAQDTLSVDESALESSEVSLESYLQDLHSAFSQGETRINRLFAALDELQETVEQALTDGTIPAGKVVIPDVQTFKGVIHNARFGTVLPEDAETGPSLRFDVVGKVVEAAAHDPSGTKQTRRVRLVGKQIGSFLATVALSDVKLLEGREAILQEDDLGGWWPTAIGEVPQA